MGTHQAPAGAGGFILGGAILSILAVGWHAFVGKLDACPVRGDLRRHTRPVGPYYVEIRTFVGPHAVTLRKSSLLEPASREYGLHRRILRGQRGVSQEGRSASMTRSVRSLLAGLTFVVSLSSLGKEASAQSVRLS